MNIIFVEPFFPQNQRRFVAALAGVGANVIGVGEYAEDELGDELRGQLGAYYRVSNVTDEGQLNAAVEWAQGLVWVDRLESTIESHQMAAARVREARHIPGTSVRTTWLCRDKPSMKEALRQAGVPTAASTAAHSVDDAVDFANAIGFPLILKPRAGAGALGTTRVDSMADLQQALVAFGDADSIAIEEFVEGHEGFYDTIAINGHVAHDWITHYYPNVLEAMRHRWISPQFVTTNRIDDSSFYGEVREMGARVIEALGIGTSATHMEWFARTQGAAFLRDRLPPTGRRRLGPLLGGQRHRCLPGVGPGDRARLGRGSAVAGVLRRHRRPAAEPGRPDPGLLRSRGDPAAARSLDPRRAPAGPGQRHPARGGGLHGQRLGPDETPRLRHPARDARRRGAHDSGTRRMRRVHAG